MKYKKHSNEKSNMLFVFVLTIVMTGGFSSAFVMAAVQDETITEKPLTLEKAIKLVLVNDRQYKIARLQVDIATNRSDQARSALLPQLSFSASKMWLKDPVEINLPEFDLEFRSPTELPLSLSAQVAVPIYIGGTIPNYLSARRLEMSEAQIAERTRQTLVFNATKAYYAILQTKHLLEVAQESVELMEAYKERAKDFYNEGIVDKRDFLQAELRLAEIRQQLFSVDKQHKLAVAMFNKMIDRDIDHPTIVLDDTSPTPLNIDQNHCNQLALTHRPELKQLQAEVSAARLALQAAKGATLPSIVGVASAQYSDSDFLDRDVIIYGGINVTLDAYSGGKKWAQISEASNRNLQASLALDELKQNLKLQVKDAWLSVQEARNKLSVTEFAIEEAQENLRIVNNQYEAQVVSSTEVLDAQTFLTNARNNHFQALYQFKTARAQLEWVLGFNIEQAQLIAQNSAVTEKN